MKIIAYQNVQQLPGGTEDVEGVNFGLEDIEKEILPELKDCLSALLEVPYPNIVARICIQRGEDVMLYDACIRIVITEINSKKVIWGIGWNNDFEGGDYVESLKVDPNREKINPDYFEEHKAKERNKAQWIDFFEKLLQSMLTSQEQRRIEIEERLNYLRFTLHREC